MAKSKLVKAKEGESIEEAKARLSAEQAVLNAKRKDGMK